MMDYVVFDQKNIEIDFVSFYLLLHFEEACFGYRIEKDDSNPDIFYVFFDEKLSDENSNEIVNSMINSYNFIKNNENTDLILGSTDLRNSKEE